MIRPLALALALLAPLAALADQGRTLGPHRFVPSVAVPDPFLAGGISVLFASGIAQGLTVPSYDQDSNELSTREAGAISIMGGGFRAQFRIIDRLSLRLNYGMNGRVGTTAASLLATGVSAVWIGTLGASVKILETETFYLTGTADVRRAEVIGIQPLEYIQGGPNGEFVPLVTQTFIWRGIFGARAAWSIKDWLGFNAFFEAGPNFTDTASAVSIATGLQASFSIEPGTGVPLGFTATYKFEKIPNELPEAARSNSISAGVFLSGRNDFAIGLDVGYSWLVDTTNARNYQLLQGRALMRYDFF